MFIFAFHTCFHEYNTNDYNIKQYFLHYISGYFVAMNSLMRD